MKFVWHSFSDAKVVIYHRNIVSIRELLCIFVPKLTTQTEFVHYEKDSHNTYIRISR